MRQRPLETLIRNGGMTGIFRSIGCIGDSLSSGEFEFDDNGQTGYWDCYDYSWGKYIERATGAKVSNYSRGGLTAMQLWNDAETKTGPVQELNNVFEPEEAKQAYVIALGVNDLCGPDVLKNVYGGEIGNPREDVCVEDYTKNKLSFVGCYCRIIQRLQQNNRHAKFFLVSMPNDNNKKEILAELLRQICDILPNCYLIDLYHEAPKYDKSFMKNYFSGGHMNAMGYQLTAWYIMTYIDWIVMHDPSEFKNVQFILSGKDPAR